MVARSVCARRFSGLTAYSAVKSENLSAPGPQAPPGTGGPGRRYGPALRPPERRPGYIRHIARSLFLYPAALLLALLAAFGAAACGDDAEPDSAGQATIAPIESTDIPGDAEHEDVAVIAGWVDTLREGDVEGAAEYFAVPSTAVNGGIMVRIRSNADAVAFNESLPCGAELVRAEGVGETVTATFRLTERPGPGSCGEGSGQLAQTVFVIEDGKIVEWRRVAEDTPKAEGETV